MYLIRHLLGNLDHLGDRQGPTPLHQLAERFAFEVLHGDVGRAVIGLAGFVNGDDIWVGFASPSVRMPACWRGPNG